jgi:hypothetical protein
MMRQAANLVGVLIMGAAMLGVLWVVYSVLEGVGLGCIGACAVRP